MKRIALVLVMLTAGFANAQVTDKIVPQVTVSGEGKIKVQPDEAVITIGVENMGENATEVKKKNDATVDAVIKYLKSIKLPETDYQTQRVSLYRNYDYNKKKYSHVASQTNTIHLKDLNKYDAVMGGLVDAGVNNIQGVEFKTSKLAQYEQQARTEAALDAKKKAADYAAALGQKTGKAIVISDSSQPYYPVMRNMSMKSYDGAEAAAPMETLAVGQIEIRANVTISFELQ